MTVLLKIIQVLLALSILILIHEAGHFCFAKMFRIRVEKFYLFFDLGGSFLFSTKRSRWFVRLFPKALEWETEYGIGWLPLGGYCKIAGMIDESMDVAQMKQAPKPWEFRTHNPWQRLLVMAGGVLYNFILAILIYIAITAIWGESYISNRDAEIYPSGLAEQMGFRAGDRVLSMDGYVPEDFGMLQADLARRKARRVDVLRGTDTVALYMDHALLPEVLKSGLMFDLAIPFVIDSVAFDSANGASGLSHGDRVTAFGGESVRYLQDARGVLSCFAGKDVDATVVRGTDTLHLPVKVDSAGRIGVYMELPRVESKSYSLLTAIPEGVKLTGRTIGGYLRDLRLLAQPSTGAYKSVGSFIAIGQVFPARWNWYQFMFLLALFSIMLGVMNLLPIPGLDGGHIVFTLYEIITGRKPSDQFMIVAQWIGMILLIALMVLAFGNDIGRLIH
ncbi:MAG: RIP metalloprotease RseP [Bacteroidales bacterium]|nr:RIP metalloprotease RseP [Bacteroidales bacterium]